ncbi:hypothetical protein PMAYCL1PPCAC_20532, partial [Pristionchus mayeri]
ARVRIMYRSTMVAAIKKNNGPTIGLKKLTIDCSQPSGDKIISCDDLSSFLREKTGVDVKTVDSKIELTTRREISKRSVKFFTYKWLKRCGVQDYVRVVAATRDSYELRYYAICDSQEASSDE